MRILLVRRGSIENVDGISYYISELAKGLARRGHDVRIMCGYLKQHYYKPLEGIPPIIPGPSSTSPTAWVKELRKVIVTFHPDIIHVNNAIPILLREVPLVMTYHGLEPLLNSRARRLRYLFRIHLTASFLCYKKVITISKKIRKELQELLLLPPASKKLVMIPIGVDLALYRRFKRRLTERELAVLHMGTRRQKNLRTTLKALKLLWREGIKVRLYITGPNTEYLRHCLNNLNDEERKHVKYGFLPRAKLLELIGKVRVYVLPSYYEAFSIATLENICCGTPVVVSTAVPEELVRHSMNGFRIEDANDFRSFAQYIKALLLDDDL